MKAKHTKAIHGISIHAAREGGDQCANKQAPPPNQFQSTPPVKAATWKDRGTQGTNAISIHAAREGGDLTLIVLPKRRTISIHAAREGGDVRPLRCTPAQPRFQSTPPVKAATELRLLERAVKDFNPRRP